MRIARFALSVLSNGRLRLGVRHVDIAVAAVSAVIASSSDRSEEPILPLDVVHNNFATVPVPKGLKAYSIFVGTELDDKSVLTKNAIAVHLEGAPFLQTNRLSVLIKHEVEVVSVLVIGLG